MKISIKEIIVKSLFGYYNYNLKTESSGSILEKLMVFYGDNGSGKTTILKLIFYLLSTKQQSGFKSEISKIKFSQFILRFTNDIEIGVIRKNGELLGSYKIYIKKGSQLIREMTLNAKEDLSIDILTNPSAELSYNKLLKEIELLGITVFYLSDQRKLFNSITSTMNEGAREYEFSINKMKIKDSVKARDSDLGKYSVSNALEELNFWISEQIIVNSKIGERNTNNIYIEIANSVIRNRKNLKDGSQRAIEISKLIDEIAIRSNEYSKLGFINSFETKQITDALKKAKSDKLLTITSILEPFVEGIKAKLDALEILKNTIQKFLDSVNNFFSKKQITYNLADGFVIKHSKTEDEILLTYLSSGERQLLLLFANTITSTEKASFFIIDEPEISLNIKWQRLLINTLLELSQNSKVQFLIATHSFELLSAQPECVIKLEDKKNLLNEQPA